MKLNPDALASHLQQRLLPVYLVSGDEPLLVGEATDAIRARARALGYEERSVHAIERGSGWDAVRNAFETLSLFASRRIVEVRLPTGKPGAEGATTLAKLIASGSPDVLLLIVTGRLERETQSSAWVKAADANGAWITVWPVGPDRLTAWLQSRCARLGLDADREALELLAERVEGNLLAASQELEKLKLLVSGRLTVAAVMSAVADSARFDPYKLGEALTARDPVRALRVLDGLRAEDAELPLILWSVVRALRSSPRVSSSLVVRAARADRMAKGQLPGDPWSELALLTAELCGRAALPRATAMLK